MRTPAGKECPYFYGDYHRGRSKEDCRLLDNSEPNQRWRRELCFSCPVPDIIRANACEHQVLKARVERTFLFLKRRVQVQAYCVKCTCDVADPYIGCGQCHPNISFLLGDESDPNTTTRP